MATLTLTFYKRGPNGRRQWFRELAGFCRDLYGEERHMALRRVEESCGLEMRDYCDLMLTEALPDCRIWHQGDRIVVEIDFDNDADAVAFHLRHVNFG